MATNGDDQIVSEETPLLMSQGVLKQPYGTQSPVAPATTFVSYTGGYTFAHFANMLERLRGEYIWMDIFSVDQFAWTEKAKTPEMKKKAAEELSGGLTARIQEIGHTALMLERWSNVMATLGQIWVVWEIFCTVDAGATFQVLLSDEERDRFTRSLEFSDDEFENFMSILAEIDVGKAEAKDPNDREYILSQVQERGVYEVNCQVTERLQKWLADTGREHVATLNSEEAQLTANENLASLLCRQGKL